MAKVNPIQVQKQLPTDRFKSPNDVSEAIGKIE